MIVTRFTLNMVDSAWSNVPIQYRAAMWSTLFTNADFWASLSWRGRFAGIANVVNCYSETEDVLANPSLHGLGGAWSKQELFKGTTVWHGLNAVPFLGLDVACEGGWGINTTYAVTPYYYVPAYGFFGNLNYSDCMAAPWPQTSNGDNMWYHSDMKNVAYKFVHPLFLKIVRGETKRNRRLGMKTNKSTIAVLLAMVSVCGVYAYAGFGLTPFQEAYQKGAEAKIVFSVIDDDGSPVKDARVNVFFDMADRSKGRRVIAQTDTNGVCVVNEKTKGVLEIEVSCKGYYRSTDLISFIDMGREHEVRKGKWQPWGMGRQITLLPVKNPVARIAGIPDWKWTGEINKWVGFDLMKYDFVEPHGIGKTSDMEVMFEWDGGWRQKDYNGMSVRFRFPRKFSGGYYVDKTAGSEYCGVYHALTNGNYKSEFDFSDKVAARDKRGNVTSWDRHFFDTSKVLVIRSRCEFNEEGTLKAANYFQISDIQYACDKRGAAVRFLSIYNPTPNDTNLEPKQ